MIILFVNVSGPLLLTVVICMATVLLVTWLQLFLLKKSRLLSAFINTRSGSRLLNLKVMLFIFNLFILLAVLYLQYSITGQGILE